ncbi:ABC transporter permease [Rickettsiales bacterium LUAb2]
MLKGFYYLYLKEVRRFMKVYGQTVVGPVITALLFLFVFTISMGQRAALPNLPAGVTFIEFLIPGLIMMQVSQNSFSNTSSSVLMSKMFGTFSDILMAPLNNYEIVLAYILGAVTRGILVAITIFIIVYIVTFSFVDIKVHSILWCVYFVIMGSFFLGVVGLICGLWSTTFDKLSTITNLIIVPLSFLSGTFYSVDNLPHFVKVLVHFNPVFYMIDGFRYGFTGFEDFNIGLEALVLLSLNIVLYFFAVFLLKKGYNTKF